MIYFLDGFLLKHSLCFPQHGFLHFKLDALYLGGLLPHLWQVKVLPVVFFKVLGALNFNGGITGAVGFTLFCGVGALLKLLGLIPLYDAGELGAGEYGGTTFTLDGINIMLEPGDELGFLGVLFFCFS